MQKSVHFRVDPKLAHVFGENYTSSEKALKELTAAGGDFIESDTDFEALMHAMPAELKKNLLLSLALPLSLS